MVAAVLGLQLGAAALAMPKPSSVRARAQSRDRLGCNCNILRPATIWFEICLRSSSNGDASSERERRKKFKVCCDLYESSQRDQTQYNLTSVS